MNIYVAEVIFECVCVFLADRFMDGFVCRCCRIIWTTARGKLPLRLDDTPCLDLEQVTVTEMCSTKQVPHGASWPNGTEPGPKLDRRQSLVLVLVYQFGPGPVFSHSLVHVWWIWFCSESAVSR